MRARPGVPLVVFASIPRSATGEAQWRITSAPMGEAPTIEHMGGNRATFRTNVEGTYEITVTVPDGGDGGTSPVSCTLQVIVRAQGPVALCPATITTAPLRRVTIAASAQSDRALVSEQWSLEAVPATSGRPQPMPADRATTNFTPDAAGSYVLRFRVSDAAGMTDTCITTVNAVPREGLRVELVWDPPGRACPRNEGAACDGSDVDLHLLREAGRARPWRSDDDCHWFNCNVSASRRLAWGMSGTTDDPRLDIDDVTGHGPENINIDRPTAGAYRVGVHYFDAHGAGAQSATVLVYCGAPTPVARLGPVTLNYRGSADTSDFWLVADVIPNAATGCEVRPIAREGAPWIFSYFEAQRGAGPPSP
jgi:hypothetical protein